MNMPNRETSGFGTSATSDRPKVELETTTTTLQSGGKTSAQSSPGQSSSASDKARRESEEVQKRAGDAAKQAKDAVAGASAEAQRKTRETAELLKEQVAAKAAAAKHQAIEQANSRKSEIASMVSDIGGALHRASEDLEKHEDRALASTTQKLADSVDSVGQHLRDSDITDLLHDVEQFMRRNPAVALGGLFVVGLAAARFLKAQPPRYQRPAGSGVRYPGDGSSAAQAAMSRYRSTSPSTASRPTAGGVSVATNRPAGAVSSSGPGTSVGGPATPTTSSSAPRAPGPTNPTSGPGSMSAPRPSTP